MIIPTLTLHYQIRSTINLYTDPVPPSTNCCRQILSRCPHILVLVHHAFPNDDKFVLAPVHESSSVSRRFCNLESCLQWASFAQWEFTVWCTGENRFPCPERSLRYSTSSPPRNRTSLSQRERCCCSACSSASTWSTRSR